MIGVIRNLLARWGWQLVRLPQRSSTQAEARHQGLHLNVGSGYSQLEGFINLDLVTEHYYGDSAFSSVSYDLREDPIPWPDAAVDTIYCSHVIEHVEPRFVKAFLAECRRVLKPAGVLRISTPDADFVSQMAKSYPAFFAWDSPSSVDKEGARRVFLKLIGGVSVKSDWSERFFEIPYNDLVEELNAVHDFDYRNPGKHVSNWDFDRLASLCRQVGFKDVIRSRYQGSIAPALQGPDMDKRRPETSLYVDAVAEESGGRPSEIAALVPSCTRAGALAAPIIATHRTSAGRKLEVWFAPYLG